jgi:hypothetical protein
MLNSLPDFPLANTAKEFSPVAIRSILGCPLDIGPSHPEPTQTQALAPSWESLARIGHDCQEREAI